MLSGEIAQIVRYCRKQSELSQQELSQLAGVGKTVIFDIEKGKETVQLDTLLKVFDVLNIKIKFETPFSETRAKHLWERCVYLFMVLKRAYSKS